MLWYVFFLCSFIVSSNAVGVVTLLILTVSHSNFIFLLLFGKNTKNKDADKKTSESVQQLIPRFIQTLLISLPLLLSLFLPIHNISSSFTVMFGLLGWSNQEICDSFFLFVFSFGLYCQKKKYKMPTSIFYIDCASEKGHKIDWPKHCAYHKSNTMISLKTIEGTLIATHCKISDQ